MLPSPEPPVPASPETRPRTPGGQPRVSEIDDAPAKLADAGADIPVLGSDTPSCCSRLAEAGNGLERRLDRLKCIPGISPVPCLRREGCAFRTCEANCCCFCVGRSGLPVWGNFRRLLLLVSLMLSAIGALLRALPAAALTTDRGTLHHWPWAHGEYTCLQSSQCKQLEADVFIGLEALLVDSANYRIYKVTQWDDENCVADLSSLGAGQYCDICRDASRGCAAMAFLSIFCSLFNMWADMQRMRARNDHNCIKAVAVVSNVLGALQLMLAVSIFQLLCVAEFPREDALQTYRIELKLGKGGALIASACSINVFNVLVHWCIPVPTARWKRGVEPWKDPALGLWPPLDHPEEDFDGALPQARDDLPGAARHGGWVAGGDEDPIAALVRAGIPRPETPDIWPDLHHDGPGAKEAGSGGNRRPSLESV